MPRKKNQKPDVLVLLICPFCNGRFFSVVKGGKVFGGAQDGAPTTHFAGAAYDCPGCEASVTVQREDLVEWTGVHVLFARVDKDRCAGPGRDASPKRCQHKRRREAKS